MKLDVPIMKRLGPVPFWRGEEKCSPALEEIYRKAMSKAQEALHRENKHPGKASS